MPLTRQQKEQQIQEATEALTSAQAIVFMSYDALNVVDMEMLRASLHEQGVSLRVMPKRLMKLVTKNVDVDFDPTAQSGQIAVAWSNDPLAPAKALYTFAKTHTQIQLLAGTMEGALVSAEQVKQLAQIPGRDELRAQLVSVLAGPLRGLAGVLSGNLRSLVYVLDAVKSSKQ